MPKQVSPPIRKSSISNGASKIIALTFGVLVVSFLAVFYIFAWTEPPYGGVCVLWLRVFSLVVLFH